MVSDGTQGRRVSSLPRLWWRGPGPGSRPVCRRWEGTQQEEKEATTGESGDMSKGQPGGPTGDEVKSDGGVLKSRQELKIGNVETISQANSSIQI